VGERERGDLKNDHLFPVSIGVCVRTRDRDLADDIFQSTLM